MAITMQYAPYELRESDWEAERETLGDHIVNYLNAYAPNLKELILHRQVITPLDWEQTYGLTEGSILSWADGAGSVVSNATCARLGAV